MPPQVRWSPRRYPYTQCLVTDGCLWEALYDKARQGDGTCFGTLWLGMASSWTPHDGDMCWDILAMETMWLPDISTAHVLYMIELLTRHDPKRVWRHNLACLKAACINGCTPIVAFFLDRHGIDPNVLNGTLLYLTVPWHPQTTAFLASRGADISIGDHWIVQTLHSQGLHHQADQILEAAACR